MKTEISLTLTNRRIMLSIMSNNISINLVALRHAQLLIKKMWLTFQVVPVASATEIPTTQAARAAVPDIDQSIKAAQTLMSLLAVLTLMNCRHK